MSADPWVPPAVPIDCPPRSVLRHRQRLAESILAHRQNCPSCTEALRALRGELDPREDLDAG